MKKWLVGWMCVGMLANAFTPQAKAQTSAQSFGTGTTNFTSQTGSAAVIPNPTGSGTTWARAGAVAPNAPIVLATAGNPLGTTGTYVRAAASASTSVGKFSPMVGYSGSTEFYTSFKVLFGDASAGTTTATNGIWAFYQGAGAMYSDASDFAGAQVFTGLRFTYNATGGVALQNRAAAAWSTAGLTSSNFNQGTVYTVEIVGNNKESGTISYTYNDVAQTVAVQKFDLFINGTRVGDDLAAAALPTNASVVSATFIGTSSTNNAANVFVDDVVVYNAVPAAIGGGAVFGVSFNKANGFTVAEGAGDAITATAANGTEPYAYAWSSTLGGTYYTAVSNVFTILATAPTGSYSATVTATDNAAQTASNTVTFSVAAPAPKYAISIVTNAPANGTVTTTPATEAVAGATVTVSATPVGGYAVQSIVVNGGAVTVTGNTFVMPAEPATVTVTFAAITAEGIVDFRFNSAPYLPVTVKDANLAVSDMALTAGTIETNITTGTYFPDEPYVEETGGWAVDNQAGAKAFQFTITPAEGAAVTINGISFKAYATAAGPSAYGFDVGGLATYAVDAPSNALLVVSQAVAGVESQTGALVVKIQGWANGSRTTTGAGVFRLDDVVVHGSVSTGPLPFSVSLNKSNGFTVEQGASDAITATAANGTAPYGYAWSSTLGGTYYTAISNVFTILATAPTGSYSATVTATDNAAQTASNTVTFSVTAPAPKYAISIVTNAPANGTVTTTPATEAVAGATVTVNATPAGGYAVESIVVNGGAVTVTGNTFVMPAAPATVTVTFAVSETPDALIDFETYAGGYNLTNYVAGGVTWTMTNAFAGNTVDDRKNGTKAARLENNRGGAGNPAKMTSTAFAQPVTKISFWYANYGANDGGKFKVQVSNDGATWQDVGEAEYDPIASAALAKATIETIPAGMTYVQFVTTAGSAQRVNVDDIGIFFGAPVLSVSVDKSNGFTVQQGQSDAIAATAANGTGPYAYAWTSTLGASYRSTNGNVFTILSTAPTGSYSATVTATDATLATAQRTVTFSVVGLGPGPAVIIAGSRTGTVGVQMSLAISVTNETANDWFIDLKDPTGADNYSYGFDGSTFTLTPTMTGTYVLVATAQTGSGNVSNTANLAISASGGEEWQIANGADGGSMFYATSNQTIMIVLPTNLTLTAVYGTDSTSGGLNSLGQGLGSTLTPGLDYTWTPATRTISILSGVTNRRVLRIGAQPN